MKNEEVESLLDYIDQSVDEKDSDMSKINFLLSEGLWMSGVLRGSDKHEEYLHELVEIIVDHFKSIIGE